MVTIPLIQHRDKTSKSPKLRSEDLPPDEDSLTGRTFSFLPITLLAKKRKILTEHSVKAKKRKMFFIIHTLLRGFWLADLVPILGPVRFNDFYVILNFADFYVILRVTDFYVIVVLIKSLFTLLHFLIERHCSPRQELVHFVTFPH